MKSINSNLMIERMLLETALEKEKRLSNDLDNRYRKYHSTLVEWYSNLLTFLDDTLGYDSSSNEKIKDVIANQEFDYSKREDIINLRNSPIYKRALGEAAMYYKADIEETLDLESDITGFDEPFTGSLVLAAEVMNPYQLEFNIKRNLSKYVIEVIKPSYELEMEQSELLVELRKLYKSNQIDKKTYMLYYKYIFHIYEYYISISEGEQLFVPRLSDANYKTLKSSHRYSFEEGLLMVKKNNALLLDQFQKMQQKNADSYDFNDDFNINFKKR